MATAPVETAMRLHIARTLAWALWLGGWLALGTLGRWFTPLWLDGLGPLALWLACMALMGAHRAGAGALAANGLLAAAALVWTAAGGGPVAVLAAAAAWGLLLAAAADTVRTLRPTSEHPARRALPAALGALLALAAAGDLEPHPAWWAGALALASLGLAAVAPRTRGGPVPLGNQSRDGIIASARWTMLPMMASLGLMADVCAAAGLASRPLAVGAHFAAMLLPPLVLGLLGRELRNPAWLALPMGAGLALYWALPGASGWLALAMCHALAWGLAWPFPASQARHGLAARLAPAACVFVLGWAATRFGPAAFVALHIALGLLALSCALAQVFPATQRLTRRCT